MVVAVVVALPAGAALRFRRLRFCDECFASNPSNPLAVVGAAEADPRDRFDMWWDGGREVHLLHTDYVNRL